MSTKKKATSKKVTEDELEYRYGKVVTRFGCFVPSEAGGTFEFASAEMLAKSNVVFATTVRDADGKEFTMLVTVKETGYGSHTLEIPASSSLRTTVRHEKDLENLGRLGLDSGVTHVGRGDLPLAATLLGKCWKTYGNNFGLAWAYRMIYCYLSVSKDRTCAWWKATFESESAILPSSSS